MVSSFCSSTSNSAAWAGRARVLTEGLRHRASEFIEELIGHFLGRAVDEPLAQLGELAADLRIDVIGKLGAAVLRRQRDCGTALGRIFIN